MLPFNTTTNPFDTFATFPPFLVFDKIELKAKANLICTKAIGESSIAWLAAEEVIE